MVEGGREGNAVVEGGREGTGLTISIGLIQDILEKK